RIRVVELPDLPPKGDIVDWQKAGGTREKFDELVERAPDWKPQPEQAERPEPREREHDAPTETRTAVLIRGDELEPNRSHGRGRTDSPSASSPCWPVIRASVNQPSSSRS